MGMPGDDLVAIHFAWAWPFFLGGYAFALGLSCLGIIAAYERSNVAGAVLLALLGIATDGYLMWTLAGLVSLSVANAIVGLLPALLGFWSLGVLLLLRSPKRQHARHPSELEMVDRTGGSTGGASPSSPAPLNNPYSPR